MKLVLWFWMLSKRLYKKATFLVILLLIPALVLIYSASAKEESGMLTVALAGNDPIARQLMEDFNGSSQLIRYKACSSAQEAEALVRYGKADMSWVFAEDMDGALEAFLDRPTAQNALVTVTVRQDDVTLKLAREKLSGAVYELLNQRLYIRYVRENVPGLSHLSNEELMEYFHTRDVAEEMFVFDSTNAAMENAAQVHYLTAPVRGLLAVVAVLCGMATAMYFVGDCQRGTFSWVSTRKMPAVELGCQVVSLVNVMAVVLLTLVLAGHSAAFLKELAAAVMYCLCVAAFSMVMRRLCGSVRVLGTVLPLIMVVILVVCPVFFDLAALRFGQYFFPPTYYINAVYNGKYFLYMLLYAGACFGVYGILGLLRGRNGHGCI